MSNIDFYFSIGSTYTYLSVTRILDVEKKHQVKFNWKPFSVRAIMKEMNNIPFPKEKMNKVNYMWRDIERRAEGYGFFAKTPVPYPLTEFDLANKLAILGLKEGWGVDYIRLTYKRWFQEGKEPATEPNISEIFKELKIDKDEIIKDANSSEIDKQYLKNTESARENKVFGSPSFIVNSEIFWGDDRMEDAITWSKKMSNLTAYIILIIAVILGTASNSFAKSAEGFTLLVPSVITAITIVACMYTLSISNEINTSWYNLCIFCWIMYNRDLCCRCYKVSANS